MHYNALCKYSQCQIFNTFRKQYSFYQGMGPVRFNLPWFFVPGTEFKLTMKDIRLGFPRTLEAERDIQMFPNLPALASISSEFCYLKFLMYELITK